jgi:streptomycin 6-kinase
MGRRLIDAACTLTRELGPEADAQLIHTDLHDSNILAGERESWLTIGPKVVAGEPAFAVAPLLWHRGRLYIAVLHVL